MPEFPIPIDDIKEMLNADDELQCAECARPITDEGYAFLGNDEAYCEHCGAKFLLEIESEAKVFAIANCKITRPIPPYDPTLEFRCTLEEYESGCRESCTPDAYRACARHEHTNYDELLKSLDTTNELNALYWFAIRDRIDELVNEAIEEASGGDWEAKHYENRRFI